MVPPDDVPTSTYLNPNFLTIRSADFRSTIDQPLRTSYIYDGLIFAIAPPRDSTVEPKITNGTLRFDDDKQYQVVQLDIDSGIIKANKFVNKIVHIASKQVFRNQRIILKANLAKNNIKLQPNNPELIALKKRLTLSSATLLPIEVMDHINNISVENKLDPNSYACVPPLRSEFISVVKNDRGQDYYKRFARSQNINSNYTKKINSVPTDPTLDSLYAQDLIRGCRIDIRDNVSLKWHSLCKRRGTYEIFDETNSSSKVYLNDFPDEGWIQTGIAREQNDDEPGAVNLKIHESLFKWQGWSLCAPRPGKPIDPDDGIQNVDNIPLTQS